MSKRKSRKNIKKLSRKNSRRISKKLSRKNSLKRKNLRKSIKRSRKNKKLRGGMKGLFSSCTGPDCDDHPQSGLLKEQSVDDLERSPSAITRQSICDVIKQADLSLKGLYNVKVLGDGSYKVNVLEDECKNI